MNKIQQVQYKKNKFRRKKFYNYFFYNHKHYHGCPILLQFSDVVKEEIVNSKDQKALLNAIDGIYK